MKKLTKAIPKAPGVYYFKDQSQAVIYVGKAKSLQSRVRSYFSGKKDFKTDLLIAEYADVDFIVTKNETEALLLEAQMVSQHKPKFNVLLKEGQPFLYILFTTPKVSLKKSVGQSEQSLPEIKVVRNKKEKGTYFGPFLAKSQARGAVRYLMETFKLVLCKSRIENGCLDYHLGKCSGNCKKDFNKDDYLFRLELAKAALKNNRAACIQSLKQKIAEYNARLDFEISARLSGYLTHLDVIFETLRTRFTPEKFQDDIFVAMTPTPEPDRKLVGEQLAQFLGVQTDIKTIDCFDISHFQSRFLVGSCVRFTGGLPEKNKFRRFKIKTLEVQNDYAALQEIVSRRYREGDIPDLILIDGGKGQLSAVKAVLPQAHCISLAKREETIYSSEWPQGKVLDIHNPSAQLLLALRDYAHHFAVSYHTIRRKKDNFTASVTSNTEKQHQNPGKRA